jgi:predicted porin
MIKKILPAMIGAALVGGMAPAVADVTVFGHLDTSVDYVDQNRSTTNLNCNTCSLGFKGSEDLGNGLKAIFKIDFQFDMTERNGKTRVSRRSAVTSVNTIPQLVEGVGTKEPELVVGALGTSRDFFVTNVSDKDAITDRDQWLGLAGNFGQVRFGTISTIYKSHGAMIDPVYRTAAQARAHGLQSRAHSGAGENGQGRAEDTFRYDSPSWNGLKLGATYTLQTDVGQSTDSPFGAGIEYKNGPFLVFADYITNDNGGDDDAAKLGGKWTFGNYSLYGQYEWDGGMLSFLDGTQGFSSNGTSRNKGDGADVWELGGTGTWGNNMLVAAYGQKEKTTGNRNNIDDADIGDGDVGQTKTIEVVGVHSLSKRTSAYLGYVNRSFDGSFINSNDQKKNFSDQNIWTLGMKHKF